LWISASKHAFSPASFIVSSTSRWTFWTSSSILAGWILPSKISFSRAILATSLRTGSKPESVMASGVSSTIKSIPVAASKARIFLPSRPIILPFISSLGNVTTLVVTSLVWSAAHFWIASVIIFLAFLSASSFALSSMSLAIFIASILASSVYLSIIICLACSVVIWLTLSSSLTMLFWSSSKASSLLFNAAIWLWTRSLEASNSSIFLSKEVSRFVKRSSLANKRSSLRLFSSLRSLFSCSKVDFNIEISLFVISTCSFLIFSAWAWASCKILSASIFADLVFLLITTI